MKNEYSCQTYNAKKTFVVCLLFWILIMGAFALISLSLKIPALFALGFICTAVLPFIFQKNIKLKFTRNTTLNFYDDGFSISFRNLSDGLEIKKLQYRWDEIKAYKFYFTSSKLTYLDIYFKHAPFKEFGFKDSKTMDESINQESVFSIFRFYVEKFNSHIQDDGKIVLAPGFLTTKLGTFVIVFTALLILTAGILHSVDKGHFTPFFFLALIVFLPILVKRKKDIELYNRQKSSS